MLTGEVCSAGSAAQAQHGLTGNCCTEVLPRRALLQFVPRRHEQCRQQKVGSTNCAACKKCRAPWNPCPSALPLPCGSRIPAVSKYTCCPCLVELTRVYIPFFTTQQSAPHSIADVLSREELQDVDRPQQQSCYKCVPWVPIQGCICPACMDSRITLDTP